MKFAGTDETRAEIEGWNALTSRIEREHGKVDRAELLTRAAPVSDFVVLDRDNQLVLAPGVKLDAGPYIAYLAPPGSQQVSTNAQAISAVYYTPELQARYPTHAVEVAAGTARHFQEKTQQAPYETRLNLGAIEQSAQSLEKAGLDLDGKPFSITDTTHSLNWIQLKHTRNKGEEEKPTIEPEEQETGKPDNIFAIQGGLMDPAHLRANMPLEAALAAPVEQTSQQVNQLAVVRQQEQQRELEQQQQVQQQRGPVLS